MQSSISYALVLIALSGCLIVANREATPRTSSLNSFGKGLWIGDVLCAGLVLSIFPLILLLTDRFLTTIAIGLALILLLWAGNRLKVAILSEVLVFSDIFLAGHALRYPRLYFGYAPKWVWPLLIIGCAGLGWCLTLEKPIDVYTLGERMSGVLAILLIYGLIALLLRRPSVGIIRFLGRHPVSFDAQVDAGRYTPLGAALLHVLHHGQCRYRLRLRFRKHSDGSTESNSGNPTEHRLLIQAESFVPLHRLLERQSQTPMIDRLMSVGKSGRLSLDWRGAYTMRSEFAVLTGLAPRELETYGFDPYRLATMIPMDSLAWKMKAKGYRTVVCHPNDARFFDRDKVMKNLGFDEFIDLTDLKNRWPEMGAKDALCGHYVSDSALLQWAVDYLHESEVPTFLFIITMEAHGPWDASKFDGAASMTEVERYEVHLGLLDEGVAKIVKAQEEGELLSVLIYGDHLPGLEVLRKSTHEIPSDTAWVMWDYTVLDELESTKNQNAAEETGLKPEMLGGLWFDEK